MLLIRTVIRAAALLVSIVSASPITISPNTGVELAVGVPSSSASAGSGNIYIQIKAATSYQWVAMGIGKSMSGAHIFMIYQDGKGNVTISPRLGTGHVMPLYDSSASVKLLAGSGVSGGFMIANIQYSASSSVISLASTSTNWISAWKTGDPLDDPSTSATVTQHDDHAQFPIDLTKASISDDSNPYVSTGTSSGSANGTSSGSGATQTSSSSNGPVIITSSGDPIKTYEMTHGILMTSSMVVLFPVGAIVLRVFGGVWLHAAIQLFTLCAIISGFGVGIKLAQNTDLLFNCAHTIFGTVIVCLFLVQPILGLLHHRQYKNIGKRSYLGISHIWYGRILIICGIINGGLGLQLANNSMQGEIAYGVIAGVIFVIYVAVMVFTGMKDRNSSKYKARNP